MPYCTIVEFEWAVGFDPEPFANIVGGRVEAEIGRASCRERV